MNVELKLKSRLTSSEDIKSGVGTHCLEWQGAKSKGMGYGNIRVGVSIKKTHRLAWELEYGLIPKGKQVCHKCDNPSCCNPKHLFLGTAKENAKDRDNKNRGALGHRVGSTNLKDHDVVLIKQRLKKGHTHASIAKDYKVGTSTITHINIGTHWSHIK